MKKLIPIYETAPDSDTVHVDDVRVEDGVYGKHPNFGVLFITKQCTPNRTTIVWVEEEQRASYLNLREAINSFSAAFFYTLSGKRIVLEKPAGEYMLWSDMDLMDRVLYEHKKNGTIGSDYKSHLIYQPSETDYYLITD